MPNSLLQSEQFALAFPLATVVKCGVRVINVDCVPLSARW